MNVKKILKLNFNIIGQVFHISKGYVLGNLISETFYNMVPILNLIMLKIVVDMIVEKTIAIENIIIVIMGFGIVQTLLMVQHTYIMNVYNPEQELKINKVMYEKMFNAVKKVDLEDIESAEFYNTYVKASGEIDTRIIEVCETFFSTVAGALAIISVITVMANLNVVFILFGFANVILNVKLMTKKNKHMYALNMKKIPFERKFDYIKRLFFLQDFAKEIRTFSTNLFFCELEESTDEQVHLVRKYAKSINVVDSFGMLLRMSISILMIIYLAYEISSGKMAVGDFMAIINAVSTLTMYLGVVLQSYPQMQNHSLYIENIQTVLNYESKIEAEGKEVLPNISEMRFEHVGYSYPSNTFSLKDISLTLGKGKKIAIVGYNGAGKSTIIKLLLRLYMPTNGTIKINGKPNIQYDVGDLRKHIAPVFQDFEIYALSVAENVLMKKPQSEQDREIVRKALIKADLYEKIASLPEGIDTIVSTEFDESGINLSGGEKQKLALARAIAMDSEILVLDEPSSSMDPESEYKLLETIFELEGDKSLVIVTHRLAFANRMDEICFVENGEITERGTHIELMDLKGKYFEFYNKQSSVYLI